MKRTYIFYSACYDKELFRRQVIILNENSIDFKIINKSNPTSSRAPLSSFFEAEIHVAGIDYEKAERLLRQITV